MKRLVAAVFLGFAFACVMAQEGYCQQKKGGPPKKAQGSSAGGSKQRASSKSSSSKGGKTARAASTDGAVAVETGASYEGSYVAPDTAALEEAPAYTPPAQEPAPAAAYAAPASTPAKTPAPAPAKAGPALTSAEDVPKDKDFESFKTCMKGQCECYNCGEGAPTHAGCYKEATFDEGFERCANIASNFSAKKEFYKDYWWNTFISEEAEKACTDKDRGGEWDNEKRECFIAVHFVINHKSSAGGKLVKSEQMGDCQKNVKKRVALNNKAFMCDRAAFGLSPCYSADEGATKRDMEMLMGIVQTGIAVGGTVLQGFSATLKDKTPTTPSNPNNPTGVQTLADGTQLVPTGVNQQTGQTTFTTIAPKAKEEGFEKRGQAMMASFGNNLGGITDGAKDMLVAGLIKGQGPPVFGKCELPNGRQEKEGNSIMMNWGKDGY